MKISNSFFGLALGAIVALVNLLAFSKALNLKFVLFVLMAVVLGLALKKWLQPRFETATYAILSIVSAVLVYSTFANILVDDAGFVIRYMNMARQGCFYCYNLSEGPVFGISSIIYGMLSCGLAMTGIASNTVIILALNFLGLSALFFFLLRIFKLLLKDNLLLVLSFSLAVMCSTRFLFSATAGLETNVHLAIIFAGIYFFFADERNMMWLFFGLSVVSKLDAVPLVVILSMVHLMEKRTEYFGLQWILNWRRAVLFAGVPLILFVGLTFTLFDGPLPQSAYAKLYFHSHPTEHWFPFLELFLERGARMALLAFALLLSIIQAVVGYRTGRYRLKESALLLGFLATMLLYYFYNPVERMIWYYALPELLLFGQLALATGLLIKTLSEHENEWLLTVSHVLMFAALSLAAVPMTTGEMQWMDRYLNTVETERIEIGHYVSQLPAGDTLASAHGHFGANYKGHVLDLSGLNSKLVTDFHRNTDSLLHSFHPRYFIQHATEENMNIAIQNNYVILQEWHQVEQYGYPKWVLWERKP